MRTSAGFCDTGLSGKMRMNTRPPRLMYRVMARRAASIWRAVRRPRCTALRPYSPNDTLLPRVATPVLRPFCCFLYLVRAGCSIEMLLVPLLAFAVGLRLAHALHRGLRLGLALGGLLRFRRGRRGAFGLARGAGARRLLRRGGVRRRPGRLGRHRALLVDRLL